MNIFPFDFVTNDAQNQAGQSGIRLRVEPIVHQAPGFSTIAEWHALHNLECHPSSTAKEPGVEVRGLLHLRGIGVRREIVQGIL